MTLIDATLLAGKISEFLGDCARVTIHWGSAYPQWWVRAACRIPVGNDVTIETMQAFPSEDEWYKFKSELMGIGIETSDTESQ